MVTLSEVEARAAAVALRSGPAAVARLLDMGYLRVPHTELISRVVASAASSGDWVQINTPPQVGKTVTAIQWTAFWFLADNPEHRIIILSYNDPYAEKNGAAVQELVKKYGKIFGLELKRGTSSRKFWQLTKGGSVYSVGLQGGVTGHTGTVILLDDYIKNREEADSTRYREKILANILTGGFTRRSPDAPVIYTGTLWSEHEASQTLLERYGRVEEGGKWRVVRLPALADRSDDPLGRSIGDPLFRVDPIQKRVLTRQEALGWWDEQRRGQNPRDWSVLFQCTHVTGEGALLTPDQASDSYRTRGDTPMVLDVLAVDPSDADTLASTKNDATGIVHVGRDRDDTVWVLGNYTMRGPVEAWSKRVVELAHDLNIDVIVYERNKGGRAIRSVIESAWSDGLRTGAFTGACPRIEDVTATKGKITRASPVAAQMIRGEVVLARDAAAPVDVIAGQLMSYQAGSGDSPDDMDAMVWGATYAYRPKTGSNFSNVKPAHEYMTW